MSIEDSPDSRELIQEQEYEREGAYHRRPFSPQNVRYDLALKLLSNTHLGESRCLGVGGGDGAMETRLANRGASVVILDLSLRALSFAHDADPRITCVQGATNLPFADNSFGVITMLETLEHIPDDQELSALKEVRRVLHPGGLCVISVPSSNHLVSPKHYRHYSQDELRDIVTSSGLEVMQEVSFRELGKGVGGPRILRKVLRGCLYGIDWAVRSVHAYMGLVECPPEKADTYMVLAQKKIETAS